MNCDSSVITSQEYTVYTYKKDVDQVQLKALCRCYSALWGQFANTLTQLVTTTIYNPYNPKIGKFCSKMKVRHLEKQTYSDQFFGLKLQNHLHLYVNFLFNDFYQKVQYMQIP